MTPETPDYDEIELQDKDGKIRIVRICKLCKRERIAGDWPDCRKTGDHSNPSGTFGEEPLEPYDDKNLGPGVEHITTRGQRRAIMAKRNLEYVPKGQRKGARVYFDMRR